MTSCESLAIQWESSAILGGSCSSHVPAIDPEDTDQKLGRLPAGSVCEVAKSNPHHLRNNKPPKIIQKHPNTPIFWGENLGRFWGVASHSPRFLLRNVPPGPFTLLGTPSQPREFRKRFIQDLYKKWGGDSEEGLTQSPTSFWWEKRKPCKKV